MPVTISPATRLQILTLRGEGLSYPQIAEKTGVHHDTVMRTVKRANSAQTAKLEQALAKREDILRRMAYILHHAAEAKDSIAAAKLIAMMEGWLSPKEDSININVLSGSVDISGLEREYAQLAHKSPTAQSDAMVNTSLSPDTQSRVLGQPSASAQQPGSANEVDGGGIPPGADGNGV